MPPLRKTLPGAFALLAFACANSGVAKAHTINFDTVAPSGSPRALNATQEVVLFTNTSFSNLRLVHRESSRREIVTSIGDTTHVMANLITSAFVAAQSVSSFKVQDVGNSYFKLRARHAVSGGNLFDTQTVFGFGLGISRFFNLAGNGVRRSEVFPPKPDKGRMVFNNLIFNRPTTVPETAAMLLLGAVLAALAAIIRKRRKATINTQSLQSKITR